MARRFLWHEVCYKLHNVPMKDKVFTASASNAFYAFGALPREKAPGDPGL